MNWAILVCGIIGLTITAIYLRDAYVFRWRESGPTYFFRGIITLVGTLILCIALLSISHSTEKARREELAQKLKETVILESKDADIADKKIVMSFSALRAKYILVFEVDGEQYPIEVPPDIYDRYMPGDQYP